MKPLVGSYMHEGGDTQKFGISPKTADYLYLHLLLSKLHHPQKGRQKKKKEQKNKNIPYKGLISQRIKLSIKLHCQKELNKFPPQARTSWSGSDWMKG